MVMADDMGRERERHKVPYGATLLVTDGMKIKAGAATGRLGSAHPPDHHRVRRYACDSRTSKKASPSPSRSTTSPGCRRWWSSIPSAASSAGKGVRPQVKLLDEQGEEVKQCGHRSLGGQHHLPGRFADHRQGRSGGGVGDVLARIPQESSRRVTLPAVCRAWPSCSRRVPRRMPACWPKFTGTVSFGKDTKGKQRLVITDLDGTAHEFLIPKDKHVTVHDGQVVNKGELIVDGPADPHDILRLQGVEALARYITDEVQDVYRLQGVKINDKHIEVIVRQMLRRVIGRIRAIPASSGANRSSVRKCCRSTTRWKPKASSPAVYENVPAGHHQGVAVDRFVHFGGIVPGNHARADRSGHHGQAGRVARPQGERDRRSPDSGRNRSGLPSHPSNQVCRGRPGRRASDHGRGG
jgi:DNA-directed RNA polymerase subunit beta'